MMFNLRQNLANVHKQTSNYPTAGTADERQGRKEDANVQDTSTCVQTAF